MKRIVLLVLIGVLAALSASAQMDMLPQIFRDLPPELQQGLPEEMSFAEYRELNRNVDFFTMFMSIFIPGYGSFQVEKPGLGWSIVGVRTAGTAMMGAALALQWNHFYDLVGDTTIEPDDFQRFLGNAVLFGGGVIVNGLAWAADVTLAYHIAKNEKDLVQYAYGIRASMADAAVYGGADASAAAREERYLRRLLEQSGDERVRDELMRGLVSFTSRYPDAPFASEALYFEALLYAEEGVDDRALGLALRSVRRYPDGQRVHDAIRLIARIVERNRRTWELDLPTVTDLVRMLPPEIDPTERAFTVGQILFRAVEASERRILAPIALEESRTFVANFPHSPFTPDALVTIGELLAAERAYGEAASYLAVVVIAWQDHPAWARAALRLGALYAHELADKERAVIVLRAITEQRPEAPEAREAEEMLSELE